MSPAAVAAARRRTRRLTGEELIFGAALAVLVLHLLGAGLAPAAAALAGAPLAFALFHARGRAVRTVLAGALGLAACADGLGAHLSHALTAGLSVRDVTGIAVAVAGIALVALAFRTALRGRSRRVKALAIPVVLVLLQWFAVPVMTAALVTNAERADAPAASSLGLGGAHEVVFRARDGVALSGWYVPGPGPAVVLMHGSHGTRADTTRHLQMLARAGHAVLAFDARGHGESAGQTNALGWRGAEDVAGAVAFLRHRPEVDPRTIAALGLSMGAEEALRAAADGVPLAAVVADGAGASTGGDQRLVQDAAIPRSVGWMGLRGVELFSGDDEPAPLHVEAHRIRVPVLLIASNAPDEAALDRTYASRIGARAELWHVRDAGHTEALARHPAAYADRVERFFDAALSR